ncbi:52 kDa repressor of the inhibitor of the protein kinase-like [Myzus persicae]|uniref:52 kDa repressor of the inhibitor of the protein kinase-like n=1 Tax=Myzus persicae TaxID=13164 RepID=UPI000B9384A5|nr:52 kDa repressor of the inhibitor of the protein kinase-like [Myzus persicae]
MTELDSKTGKKDKKLSQISDETPTKLDSNGKTEIQQKVDDFLLIISKKQKTVAEQLNSEYARQILQNQFKLCSIVKTIILCGRLELSTRDKKDYGKINTTVKDKSEGKVRALLKFRANAGDEILKDHLETGAANAQYTSAKTQNKLIENCGQVITEQIVNKIIRVSFFSVMADETTDIGRLEQMSLCVRYIDPDNEVPTIREDFLNFVVDSDLSGSGLASVILENLKNHGIILEKMVGQGYDGAAAMSGHLNGVQSIVRRTFPRALYVHCSAHSLNLAISDACKISAIRNCVGSVSSVCTFFRGSAQRTEVLKKCIQAQTTLLTNIKMTLVTMCETRWVLRHDCIKRFKEMFIPIVNALEHLEKSVNKETSTTAHQLSRVILNGPSRECLDLHISVLPDSGALKEEFLLWKTKWLKINKNERLSNALQLLSECNGIFYPNITKMLEILVTLPVSTATADRTFSSLRRIKTYLRSTTSESRLLGLALLSIHNNIPVNPDEILSKFASVSRRMDFIL